MMRKLEAQMTDMASATEQQAKAVRTKSTVRLDTEKVVDVLTDKVASKYEAMIEQSALKVEEALEAQESRLEVAGEQKVTEMAERLQKAAEVLERANERSAKLSRVITWHSVGRLLLALLPLALFALAVALVLDLGGAMLNINGLYAWAWSMFEGAQQWWSKGLIALGTLVSAAGLGWLVYRGGKWLHEVYQGWR
ncbi:hypothetical protein [Glutamicibacter sp. BW78]|uniref:hypothetical protein n=1 Tax=Glutamicibacter sp. BW78 TaxID=2024403 RepID=UPI00130455D4|nr:hypothetical protein [Glutamicibacter sp. BW78]